MLPENEIRILMYETIANGGNVWINLFPEDIEEKDIVKGIGNVNEIIRKNENIFVEAKSLSNVVLLYPLTSSNFYRGATVPLTDFTKEIKAGKMCDIGEEFSGFYEILSRNKIQFYVIDEENLNDLSKYEILILPNASCLSKKNVLKIKDFVEKGGNLISTFETSLYNEKGEFLGDFQLSDLFGIKFTGKFFGPNYWDYIYPVSDKEFLKGITKKYLPAVEYGMVIKNNSGEVYIYFYEKLNGCYDEIPKISDVPFLILNKYGRGRSIYINGTFGSAYYKYRFPEYKKLIKNICEKLSHKFIKVEDMNGLKLF